MGDNMVDISNEKEFGAEPKPEAKPRRIANLAEIIDSNKTTVDLEMENGSVIEAKHLGALKYQLVMRKYPIASDTLSKVEQATLTKAYKKHKGDDTQWLLGLSAEERKVVVKVTEADVSMVPRTALILSYISVNPKLTELEAVDILESFQNPGKFANFCTAIQKLTETPDDDIKNS
jgi:hypothetical protein